MKKLTVNQTIGLNIRAYRKDLGLNQSELGSAIGLSRLSIVNMEAGRQATTPDKFLILCSVFSCTPNQLFPPVPPSKASQSVVHISFKNKKAQKECLDDPAFVNAMNKMITKAYFKKYDKKKIKRVGKILAAKLIEKKK